MGCRRGARTAPHATLYTPGDRAFVAGMSMEQVDSTAFKARFSGIKVLVVDDS